MAAPFTITLPTLRAAVPLLLVAILLGPSVGTILSGRDLQQPETLDPGNLNVLSEWLLRFITMGIVGLAVLLIGEKSLRRHQQPPDAGQLLLIAAFAAFFIGNVIVPGLLGEVPVFQRNYFYVGLVMLAIYARREDGVAHVVDVLKWVLIGFMALSFAYAIVSPDGALRTYAPELRLPWVPFRFWGLGPSSNAMGPLALVMILLLITRPIARRPLSAMAHILAWAVLLLAQSQTAWIATALIVPAMLIYRRQLATGDKHWHFPPGLILATAGAGIALVIVVLAIALASKPVDLVEPTNGLTGYGELLTGRGSIWRVAIKIFLESPLFGYGVNAWTLDFRTALNMPYATSAHNQWLQALSVGGICGFVGVTLYIIALTGLSFGRAAQRSGGLAPALMAMTLLRCLTEAPLDMGTLLVVDVVIQALLFAVLLDRIGLGARDTAQGSVDMAQWSPPDRVAPVLVRRSSRAARRAGPFVR
ncbi:MAG: O-antigen ligase family protein [Hyphomicrobiaceae bacterium]